MQTLAWEPPNVVGKEKLTEKSTIYAIKFHFYKIAFRATDGSIKV
jgi:hypothetical protein